MPRWSSLAGFVLSATMLAISATAVSRPARAQIGIDVNVTIAPPELPDYDQPPLPAPGYLWIPGYWAWGLDGYYWVPGYWEQPPEVGLLWTPGYWGWHDGSYAWNEGYWGPHVGFYGGVNYGFGYAGDGYLGGRWDHGVFAYNQTVNNFGGVHVTNVYNQTVVVNNVTRVSFNGGSGGTAAQPTQQQVAMAHEQHIQPTAAQMQHQQTASANPALRASENHGRPEIAAVSKPNEFSGKGVVASRPTTPANYNPQQRPGAVGGNPNAAKLNPNAERPPGASPNAAKLNPNAERPPGINSNAGKPPERPAVTDLEKKEPVGNPAALKGGNPPKPLNTESKTLGNNPPPAKPAAPQPHVASAPNSPAPKPPAPHPVAAVHPPAPPHPAAAAPHPVAAVHPPAPHPQARPTPHPPAPHPQARPAPHPANNKKNPA